jgi:hypothetical protein
MFDVLFQCVKDRFPKLNWKLGSVIRSLLIDPLEKIGSEVDAYSTKLKQNSELQRIIDDPIGKNDELDYWMYQLGLQLPATKSARGEVTLCLSSTDVDFTVPVGAAFTWNDGTLLRAEKAVQVNGKTVDKDNRTIAVPVISAADIAVDIQEGASVVWDAAPDSVVDMYVSSAITGGLTSDSENSKAALIRATLVQPSVCGADAILSAMIRKFGTTIVDVKLGPISKLSAGLASEVSLYIKQRDLPRMRDNKYTFDAVEEAIKWISSTQCGAPFAIVGKAPICAFVNLQIDVGGLDINEAVRSEITSYINHSKLDAVLSDTDIKQILGTYGYTVERPILYTATMDTGTGVYAVSQTGGLYISPSLASEVKPVAMYCSFDNIKTY